jgi:hypothetical protein
MHILHLEQCERKDKKLFLEGLAHLCLLCKPAPTGYKQSFLQNFCTDEKTFFHLNFQFKILSFGTRNLADAFCEATKNTA